MRFWIGLLLVPLVVACGKSAAPATRTAVPASPIAGFALISPAFQPDTSIPARFTCDGEGVSPPLTWVRPPAKTAAFALLVDDPDAPGRTFTHWLIWNLPTSTSSLPEGAQAAGQASVGGVQGHNDGGSTGYTGPCPPAGPAHHYRFILYALGAPLTIPAGATADQFRQAVSSQTLAQTQFTATYQRAAR